MKKHGILNAQLEAELTKLRHQDRFAIVDMGFPIPEGRNWVDISFVPGTPDFMLVLKTILRELVVEEYTIFDDMEEYNNDLYTEVTSLLTKQDVHKVAMEEFIEQVKTAKLVIRTGEFKPCSNIILTSASGVQDAVDEFNIDC